MGGRRSGVVLVLVAVGLVGGLPRSAAAQTAAPDPFLRGVPVGVPSATPLRLSLEDALKRYAMAISINTVAEALSTGVPMVIAPIRHDQPVVAGWVAGRDPGRVGGPVARVGGAGGQQFGVSRREQQDRSHRPILSRPAGRSGGAGAVRRGGQEAVEFGPARRGGRSIAGWGAASASCQG